MIGKASSATRQLRADPEHARYLILSVEQTGREALSDLRRLLGMLRRTRTQPCSPRNPDSNSSRRSPRSIREAGVECELRTIGEPVELMLGVNLVGYRVVEAALRTAAEHHASHAVATVRYEPDELELEVRGDSTIGDLDELLRGVSQRVALYDGTLRALPAGGDGFALRARLPLGGLRA